MSEKLQGEDLGSPSTIQKMKASLLRYAKPPAPISTDAKPSRAAPALDPIAARIAQEKRSALSPHDMRRSKRAQPMNPVQLNLRVEQSSKTALADLAEARGTSLVGVRVGAGTRPA